MGNLASCSKSWGVKKFGRSQRKKDRKKKRKTEIQDLQQGDRKLRSILNQVATGPTTRRRDDERGEGGGIPTKKGIFLSASSFKERGNPSRPVVRHSQALRGRRKARLQLTKGLGGVKRSPTQISEIPGQPIVEVHVEGK